VARNTTLRRAVLGPLPANHSPLPVAISFLERCFQPQLDQPQHRANGKGLPHGAFGLILIILEVCDKQLPA
jgi:hypothetical protein